MTYKILAAIDGFLMSQPVFDTALSFARSFKAELGLLYAFSFEEFEALPHPKLETLEEYPSVLGNPLKCYIGHLEPARLDATGSQIYSLLQDYAQRSINQGLATEFFLGVGAPGVVICDFARGWRADLIVVGHRGRSGLTALLLGSVSNYVAQHAPCSVHIVHPPSHLALKGSETTYVELQR